MTGIDQLRGGKVGGRRRGRRRSNRRRGVCLQTGRWDDGSSAASVAFSNVELDMATIRACARALTHPPCRPLTPTLPPGLRILASCCVSTRWTVACTCILAACSSVCLREPRPEAPNVRGSFGCSQPRGLNTKSEDVLVMTTCVARANDCPCRRGSRSRRFRGMRDEAGDGGAPRRWHPACQPPV